MGLDSSDLTKVHMMLDSDRLPAKFLKSALDTHLSNYYTPPISNAFKTPLDGGFKIPNTSLSVCNVIEVYISNCWLVMWLIGSSYLVILISKLINATQKPSAGHSSLFVSAASSCLKNILLRFPECQKRQSISVQMGVVYVKNWKVYDQMNRGKSSWRGETFA